VKYLHFIPLALSHFPEAMANSLCSVGLVALSLLAFPIGSFALRSRSWPDTQHAVESLVQEAANTTEAISGLAITGPANVDIADIRRYGFRSWYIVKDGRSVKDNYLGTGKYVSAKPRNIVWDRIGEWKYDRSLIKTGNLIKIKLAGPNGATLVKCNLALRFQYGGRVKQGWQARPELANKGRFLRNIRIIPEAHANSHYGYSLNARVSKVSVRRIGTRSDPIAEAKLEIRIQYGRKGTAFRKHKRVWEITVRGTGHYSARQLSSTR
jgi:hypothetical protein